MSFSLSSLLLAIQRHLPSEASGDLCVAFSGGLDSTVLLHALARIVAEQPALRLRAIHIDHQLQPQSAEWNRHCAEAARALGVEYLSEVVTVARDAEVGIEAAARTARYAALSRLLRPHEILLTAHHADDQLETMLLALARGAGLHGLAAMPACQRFGTGWQLRPLLEFTRADLEQWAQNERLTWIADPSNEHLDFSRNFLRHEITPKLRFRWPAIADSAVRATGHLSEGVELLDELARMDMANAAVGPCLRVEVLETLSSARRRNLLRLWLRDRGARAPSTRKLLALEHDMLKSQADRIPVVDWDDIEVRRFRGLLYVTRAVEPATAADMPTHWDWRQPLELPPGLGTLRTELVSGAGLARTRMPDSLVVEFRRGGEELRPAGAAHRRTLKNLFQEADILPWWRDRLPLLRVGDALAAVADLWIAEEFAAARDDEGLVIVWDARPQIRAIAQ